MNREAVVFEDRKCELCKCSFKCFGVVSTYKLEL